MIFHSIKIKMSYPSLIFFSISRNQKRYKISVKIIRQTNILPENLPKVAISGHSIMYILDERHKVPTRFRRVLQPMHCTVQCPLKP